MARYTCPSCGAPFNGKKCSACFYEHFSEEITHGAHIHRGEPLVIDAPARRPIPKKDPFGCEKTPRKRSAPREKKQRPFAGLLTIFMLIYALLPMVRNWGLELESREQAAPEPAPQDLVAIHEEGPITVSVLPEALLEFPSGMKIWVENRLEKKDVYVTAKHITVNGFVLPQAGGVYVQAAAGAYGMDTLYLDEYLLESSFIQEVKELSFVLECVDAENYTVLFETEPITFRLENVYGSQPRFTGAVTLLEEDGILLQSLGYWPDREYPKFENGQLRFYVENNTASLLSMNSLDAALGGESVNLYLWADLPAGSRAVVSMDLWALEDLEFTTPSELGDLTMTLEFYDPDNYSASVREYKVTAPMNSTEPVVVYE